MKDSAFVVCEFVRGYSHIWDRYFPGCARRAHWQIAQLVRMSEDGELFSVAVGRTNEMFGMDEATCLLRTRELIQEGLIKSENEIHASTCLYPTPPFIEKYDNHVLEAVQLLYETAKSFDQTLPRLGGLRPGTALNKRFFAFFADYREVHNDFRVRFLRGSIPNSRALQVKALRTLMTYAYWYIFTTAWMHQHEEGGAKRPYLLVDDFHPAIFEHTGISSKTTSDYIKELIAWGFLQRLDRKDGVPRGKFAVRMPGPVFEFFRQAFVAATKPIVAAACDFSRMSAEQPSASGTAAVIGFPVGSRENENVSETSPNTGSAVAPKKG